MFVQCLLFHDQNIPVNGMPLVCLPIDLNIQFLHTIALVKRPNCKQHHAVSEAPLLQYLVLHQHRSSQYYLGAITVQELLSLSQIHSPRLDYTASILVK